MKKPAFYLAILFFSIICSTVLVSTTVSSICKSFYKNDTENNVKVAPVDNKFNDIKQASVKL